MPPNLDGPRPGTVANAILGTEPVRVTPGARLGGWRRRLAGIPSVWVGLIELTLAMATIASGFLASNVVTETLPVMLASSVRYTVAALLLLPILLLSGPVPRPSAGTWWLLLGVALGGTLVFNVGLLYGLRFTSVVEAGIITSTTPMLVGVLGLFLFREHLSRRSWLAIAAATSGVLLVVVQPGEGSGEATGGLARLGGLLLILLAASGEASFNVIGRRLPRSLSSVAASVCTMVIAVGLFLPGAIVEVVAGDRIPASRDGWLAVVFLAAVPSATGLLLWADGVRRVSLGVAGAMTALIPVFTTLLAVALIGESLGVSEAVGMVIVVASLVFLARSNRPGPTILS